MSWQEVSPISRDLKFEPGQAARLGAGMAVAPLWAAFYAAAGVGVTWWLMTAWTRARPGSFQPAAPAVPDEARSFAPVEVEAQPETEIETAHVAPEAEAEAVMAHQPVLEAVAPEAPAAHPAEPSALAQAPVTKQTAPKPAAPKNAEPNPAESKPAVLAAEPLDLAAVVDEAPADLASSPAEAVSAVVETISAAGARRKAPPKRQMQGKPTSRA